MAGEGKGKGISNFSVGGNMGGALGPVLVGWGMTVFGVRGTAVLALPAVAMTLFMVTQHGRFAEFAAQGGRETAAAAAAGQRDDWRSFAKLTGVVFLRSTIATGMSKMCIRDSSYNVGKPYHPKENGWVGYIIRTGDGAYYLPGE